MAAPKKTAPKKATVIGATHGAQGELFVVTSTRQGYMRFRGEWIAAGGKVPGRGSIEALLRVDGNVVAITSDGHAYSLVGQEWVEAIAPIPGTTAAG